MSYLVKNTGKLAGRTIFVSGGSRGIGKEIALKAASDGANVVIAAKTVDPHPKLEGTIFTAAKEVEQAGGKCLPVQMDLRDEEQVEKAFKKTIEKFGGIDILVNNASAINLTNTLDTTMKKYDLMHQINTRGTFLASKLAIPHLKQSSNPHILNLSPPLEMKPHWFERHVAYTMAKYGMSMCVLGMASELKKFGIGVNALWPRTMIWTAAVNMLQGAGAQDFARKPSIMADAAYTIFNKDPKTTTGNFFIDETLLKDNGITDFDFYAMKPGHRLTPDFFLPEHYYTANFNLKNFGFNDDSSQKAAPAESSTPAEGSLKSAAVFDEIKKIMTDEVKNQLNSVIAFAISGQNWFLDAHSTRPFLITQTELDKVDVTMITDDETFVKMAKGQLNPTSAFMSGKLKIKGNLAVAMKVEKLFKTLKK